MRISVVNECRKDIKYVIADDTPEMNLPQIPEGKRLFIINKFSGEHHEVTMDEVRMMFPYLIYKYNLFIRNIIPDVSITDDLLNQKLDELNQKLLDMLDEMMIIKFSSDNDSVFNNVLKIEFNAAEYFEVNGVKFPTMFTLNFYNKDEFNNLTKDKLQNVVDDFNQQKNSYIEKYLRVLLYLNIPSLHEFPEITFDDTDLSIPEVNDEDYEITMENPLDETPIPPIDFNGFNDSFLNENASNLSAQLDEVLNKLEYFNDIDDIKKYAYVRFSCVDQTTHMPIRINGIKINDVQLIYPSYTYEKIGDKTYYIVKREVFTNPYKITFIKRNYQEKTYYIRPKFAKSIDDVNVLDLGDVELFSEASELLFTLTWGRIPEDLDFHVYSFDENMNEVEHVWFDHMHSDISDIYLDYDDITSYGPEHVQIFNIDPSKYYLFSIHNYSLMKYELVDDAHMDFEEKTNVRISFYGQNINIEPITDGNRNDYWLDAFIIHDEKFYIINSFASELRSKIETFDFNTQTLETKSVFKKFNAATKIYTFNQFRNHEINEINLKK